MKIFRYFKFCILIILLFAMGFKPMDIQTEYKAFLAALPSKQIDSISRALNEYKRIAGNDKILNDELYRAFNLFYKTVMNSINNALLYENEKFRFTNARLKKNGIRKNFSKAGDFIWENPGFLLENFSTTITSGAKLFIQIKSSELKQFGEETGTYLIEDGGLGITWDQLSDRIIWWEDFITRYPSYIQEVKNAEYYIHEYLELYTADPEYINRTPIFEWNTLKSDIKQSYERFMQKYSESKYYPLIKGYYEILKKNHFAKCQEAEDYLIQKGIRVDWGRDPEEE